MFKISRLVTRFLVVLLGASFFIPSAPATAAQSGDLTVTVHYARQNADFTGRYAWIWYEGTNATGTFTGTGVDKQINNSAWVPVDNAGIDSYGAVSTFTLSGASNVDKFGIIECSTNSWEQAPVCVRDAASSGNRFILVTGLNTEVWLRSGSSSTADKTIYTEDSLSPNQSSTQKIRVHYNRTDGSYAGWKLHLGTESKLMPASYWVSAKTYDFDAANPVGYTVGTDQFGAYVDLTLPYYAGQVKTLNMIVYSLATDGITWTKDGGNLEGHRYLSADPAGTTNVWLVSGDTTGNAAFSSDPGNISGTPSPTPTDTSVPTVTPTPTDTSVPTVTPTPTSTSSGNAPVITGLSAVSATEGDLVIISGSDLQVGVDTPTVTVGGVDANVISSDVNSVTFLVPAGVPAGSNQVVVKTSSGTSNGFALSISSNLLSPTLTGVTDEQGTPISEVKSGDVIKLTGTNLADTTNISFAGLDADLTLPGTIITDTSITVTVPESISGSVTVTTPNGTSNGVPVKFLNVNAPTIDLIDPASAAAGDEVAIGGSYLLGATVTVGGVTAVVSQSSSSLVVFVMPALENIGAANVVVSTEGGTATSSIDVVAGPSPTPTPTDTSSPQPTDTSSPEPTDTSSPEPTDTSSPQPTDTSSPEPTDINAPTIDLIDPASAAAGDEVAIGGSYLLGATVTVGGVTAVVSQSSSSLVVFVMPALENIGAAIVVVSTEGGTATSSIDVVAGPSPTPTPTDTSSPQPTDTSSPEPTDTSSPQPTDTSSPEPTDTSSPQPTDTSSPEPTDTSSPQPTDTSSPEPTDTSSPEPTDTSSPSPSPTQTSGTNSPQISIMNLSSGVQGQVLTIFGSNLATVSSVTFNGLSAAEAIDANLSDPLTEITDSSLKIVIPSGAKTGSITLRFDGVLLTTDGVLEVVYPPAILSISQSVVRPGQIIEIQGSNLKQSEVKIGGKQVAVQDGATDELIKVVVPKLAPGTTELVLSSVAGQVKRSVTIKAQSPVITSFKQSVSKKRGVSTVTVLGKNLDGAVVRVGSFIAKLRPGASSKRLVFVIPKRALLTAKGSFTITTTGGVAKSKATLKVTAK